MTARGGILARTIVPVVALLVAGCSSTTAEPSLTTNRTVVLSAETASFDLAVGTPDRYLVGLFGRNGERIVDGTVEVSFTYLGTNERPVDEAATAPRTATFVAVAGNEDRTPEPEAHLADPEDGTGVYSLADTSFDRAGNWQATVEVTIEGEAFQSDTAFEVLAEHVVAMPGDPAKPSTNRLAGDPEVPPSAIDSRASDTTPIPDPQLHNITMADAIATGKPTLLVVSTPTYCISRYCGPITETVEKLSTEFESQANFLHFEVWNDFESTAVNQAAADWILSEDTRDGGNEPWVFLIGKDGRVLQRWDNVTNRVLLESALSAAL